MNEINTTHFDLNTLIINLVVMVFVFRIQIKENNCK